MEYEFKLTAFPVEDSDNYVVQIFIIGKEDYTQVFEHRVTARHVWIKQPTEFVPTELWAAVVLRNCVEDMEKRLLDAAMSPSVKLMRDLAQQHKVLRVVGRPLGGRPANINPAGRNAPRPAGFFHRVYPC